MKKTEQINIKGMLQEKCRECENDTFLKNADLQIDYDKAQGYIKLLEKCLDVKEELLEYYRNENEELKNKVKLYKAKLERITENEGI